MSDLLVGGELRLRNQTVDVAKGIAGVLAYFGRYFLLVLLLHMVVLRWLFGAMAAWFPSANALLLSSMFIVGMLLSVLLIEVVKRSVVLSTLLLPLSQRAKAVR